MKIVRYYSEKPITVIITMFIFILATSCQKVSEDETIPNMKNHPKSMLSGQDWFRSIIFADGPMTSHIDCLADMSPIERNLDPSFITEMRSIEDSIINIISLDNPAFFKNFKKTIEKENVYKIKDVIDESYLLVRDATNQMLSRQNSSLEKEYQNLIATSNIDGDVLPEDPPAAGVAILIVVVIVIAIAININVTKTKNIDVDDDEILMGIIVSQDPDVITVESIAYDVYSSR